MNKQKTEAWVRVLANMVYNYNGSDPKKPPYGKYGVLNAGETLKELLEESIKQERKRVIKEIKGMKKNVRIAGVDLENIDIEMYQAEDDKNYNRALDDILELLSKN